jgi:hypothetical protein
MSTCSQQIMSEMEVPLKSAEQMLKRKESITIVDVEPTLADRFGVGIERLAVPQEELYAAEFERIARRAGMCSKLQLNTFTFIKGIITQWLHGVLNDAMLLHAQRCPGSWDDRPMLSSDILRSLMMPDSSYKFRRTRVFHLIDARGTFSHLESDASHMDVPIQRYTTRTDPSNGLTSVELSLVAGEQAAELNHPSTLSAAGWEPVPRAGYGTCWSESPEHLSGAIYGEVDDAAECFRNPRQSTDTPADSDVGLRRIVDALASRRGTPRIAGIPGGHAVPELHSFVIETFQQLKITRGSSLPSPALDDTATGVLAWAAERFLDTLLGTTVELVAHVSMPTNWRWEWFYRKRKSETIREKPPLKVFPSLCPKDVEFALRIMGVTFHVR